jgi:hypothetical protein
MNRQQSERDPEPWYRQARGFKQEYDRRRARPTSTSFKREGSEKDYTLYGIHSEQVTGQSDPLFFKPEDEPVVEAICEGPANLTVEKTLSGRQEAFRGNADWVELPESPFTDATTFSLGGSVTAVRFSVGTDEAADIIVREG